MMLQPLKDSAPLRLDRRRVAVFEQRLKATA